MSAGGGTSEHFAPLFEKLVAIVIDNSSQWRMAEDIDLIVPEVNEPTFTRVSLPIQTALRFNLFVPLKVLQDAYGFKTKWHIQHIKLYQVQG